MNGVSGRARVLEIEPTLGEGVQGLPAAAISASAAVWPLTRGRWRREPWMFERPGSLGLLVIEGLIARQLLVGGMEAVELVGPGDVLRPWAEVDRGVAPQVDESWIVTRRASLALLDRSFAVAVSPWPEIAANIGDRVAMRVGWLGLFSAIQGIRRVDERLLAVLWSYAERWGRVTPEGVLLELELTHRLLAGVISARRPSVTTALKSLEDEGALTRRRDRTWLLHGERPAVLTSAYSRPAFAGLHPATTRGSGHGSLSSAAAAASVA